MARNKKRKNKPVKGLDDGAGAADSPSASDGDEHDVTTTTTTTAQHEAQQQVEQHSEAQRAAATTRAAAADVRPTAGEDDKDDGGEGGAADATAAAAAAATSSSTTTKCAAVQVLYCPNCTFPAEYCEFSGMYEQCRPWLLEHAAELADAVERGRKRRVLTQHGRLEAMMAGKGVKKALERAVVLETARVKGGAVTFVTGMDLFGHNLKDLSKEWRKKFSCGGGVRDADEVQKQAAIQMQGSLETQLSELLVSKYSIPKEAIYTMQNKKRVRVF